jgi:hypothetical protein
VLKTKLAQGGTIRLDSDQMLLVMAGNEVGPCERWPKILKGELKNNSRKPRDLVSEHA